MASGDTDPTEIEGNTGPGVGDPDAGSPPPDAPPPGPAAPSLIGLTLGGSEQTDMTPGIARAAAVAASTPGASETLVGLGANVTLDGTRQEIAFRLIMILAIVIGAYLFISLIFSLSCWTSHTCTVQESYNMSAASFTTVFTALIGIVGSVVGFYFGSKTH